MASTAQTIIVQSFVDLNAVVNGETPASSELNDGLVRLNQLITSLNAEGTVLWEKRSETKANIAASFTMGPTGDLVTDRPLRLLAARCSSGNYGRGLRIITDPVEWAAIMERGTLTLPLSMYVDYQFPNVILHVNPAPAVAATLTIDTMEAFVTLAPDSPPVQQQSPTSFMRKSATYVLAPGVTSYNLGPTGTAGFVTSRPAQVISASVGFAGYRHPLSIIGSTEWEMLLEMENTGIVLPLAIYPVFSYPNATMNFYPAPGANVTAEIHSPRQIAQLAALNTAVDLPSGQERLLHFLLAIDMFPIYARPGVTLDSLMANATMAKNAVIAANIATGMGPSPQQSVQPAQPAQAPTSTAQ